LRAHAPHGHFPPAVHTHRRAGDAAFSGILSMIRGAPSRGLAPQVREFGKPRRKRSRSARPRAPTSSPPTGTAATQSIADSQPATIAPETVGQNFGEPVSTLGAAQLVTAVYTYIDPHSGYLIGCLSRGDASASTSGIKS